MENAITLEYKGYKGTYSYSYVDECYHGLITNIDGLVTFEGDNITELAAAFFYAVNDYIKTMKDLQ